MCLSFYLIILSKMKNYVFKNIKNELYIDHCWMYLVTAFVPYETACLASSPGRMSLTADWTSRDERVLLLLNLTSLDPSVAILSKVSWMNEFMMFIAFFEIPMSGCTCFKTL